MSALRTYVKIYFDLLQNIFDKNRFVVHLEAICNMDEIGMPLEPNMVAQKLQNKVWYQTSGQKQQITCGSAVGHHLLYLLQSSSFILR